MVGASISTSRAAVECTHHPVGATPCGRPLGHRCAPSYAIGTIARPRRGGPRTAHGHAEPMPRYKDWQPSQDSNLNLGIQSPACYRCTTRLRRTKYSNLPGHRTCQGYPGTGHRPYVRMPSLAPYCTTPFSRSSAISPSEYRNSRRISSVCWPRTGAASPSPLGGVSEKPMKFPGCSISPSWAWSRRMT